MLIALMQTPHRFRTKRQLWAYSSLAILTHDSAEYRYAGGQEGPKSTVSLKFMRVWLKKNNRWKIVARSISK